ncbi:hypothetical protein DYB32_002147 [Aphanomyces invadans]|uniref:Rho-GAP domain-containing protein n=1 Tax=Aphanomyces invadans TaxID=157072 RepID=A0A3R6Z855_9STRA|nr:hypothetical protein DYB32_002147 [Aphanomyces invadans]
MQWRTARLQISFVAAALARSKLPANSTSFDNFTTMSTGPSSVLLPAFVVDFDVTNVQLHNVIAFAMPSIHDRFTLQAVAEREGRQYVHARPTMGVAPPKIVTFLCKSLEAAASRSARSICMIYVTHLPATSDGSMASHFEHMKILLGSDSDMPLGQAMVVAADELWPHKVKMNTGELSNETIPPECLSGLLLDWLEHLQVPIVEDTKVLATGAAFNGLPLLTLRTLECIFHLIRSLLQYLVDAMEQDYLPSATAGCIGDAVIGRTTMACLQLSAVAAKPYFSKVKHLVDTWSCPKPLPLNGARIAELNLALPEFNDTHDGAKETSMESRHHSSSSSLHAEKHGDEGGESPKTLSSPKHSSSAPYFGDATLPPVKPPSPAHHSPANFSGSSFSDAVTRADDAAIATPDPQQPLRPEPCSFTGSKPSSLLTTSPNAFEMKAPVTGIPLTDESSTSPQKGPLSISEAPLPVSVRDISSMKGHGPRSLPALQMPRKPATAL